MNQRLLTGCHENTANNQELLIMSTEDTEKYQHDAGSPQDTETNWYTANTDIYRIVSIDIEGLCGPEHEHGEEVCARNKRDDERETESPRLLLQASWEDGVFGAIDFPKGKCD